MSKPFKPGKSAVKLAAETARPSRIRRDPLPPVAPKSVSAYPTEREMWTVVIGVILFALAIAIITVGVSDFTNG